MSYTDPLSDIKKWFKSFNNILLKSLVNTYIRSLIKIFLIISVLIFLKKEEEQDD